MATDILEKLFGGAAKVKIIKLFLFNPELMLDLKDVAERAKISKNTAKRECNNLEKMKLIRPRSYFKPFFKNIKRRAGGKAKRIMIKKRVNGWILNRDFDFLEPLEDFLSAINPFKNNRIVSRISRAGKIQLLLIAGIFIKNPESRIDLLVVGDNMKKGILENAIRTIESEIGRQIRYVIFDTKDFQYRYYMFDRLIRDILDYPHQKIINKLNL